MVTSIKWLESSVSENTSEFVYFLLVLGLAHVKLYQNSLLPNANDIKEYNMQFDLLV